MVKRNAPCPCNSGLRYKKCCGDSSKLATSDPEPVASDKTPEEKAAQEIQQGNQLLRQARNREALSHYEKALSLTPDNPEIYNLTGYIHFMSGELDLALDSYKNVIRLNPAYPDVYFSFGNVLQNLGRDGEAVSAYKQALQYNPDNFKILTNMGVSLARIGNYEEGVSAFREASRLNPADIFAHKNLARILTDLGSVDEAEKVLLNFLAQNGDNTEITLSLARLYERLNNPEQSRVEVEKILRKDPANPSANLIMASLLRHQNKAAEGLSFLSGVMIPTHDRQLAMEIHYELGRLYDRQRKYSKAMQHFSHANRLWRENSPATAKEDYFQQVSFTRQKYHGQKKGLHDLVASRKSAECPQPVFQVGFPRSGTTLLANILDSHPGTVVLAEKKMLEAVLNHVASQHEDYPDILLSIPEKELGQLRDLYWKKVQEITELSSRLLIDEHPFNMVHCNLVARMFPGAPIIINLRHPCDVCLSCFMQSFQDNVGMANFTSLGDTVALYVEVMGLLLEYEQNLPLSFHRFRYEGLIEDFTGEMNALTDFLALPWSDTFYNFNDHARTKKIIATSSYSQVVEPLYTRAKYRWLHYREHLEPFLPALQPFIEAFGYDEV